VSVLQSCVAIVIVSEPLRIVFKGAERNAKSAQPSKTRPIRPGRARAEAPHRGRDSATSRGKVRLIRRRPLPRRRVATLGRPASAIGSLPSSCYVEVGAAWSGLGCPASAITGTAERHEQAHAAGIMHGMAPVNIRIDPGRYYSGNVPQVIRSGSPCRRGRRGALGLVTPMDNRKRRPATRYFAADHGDNERQGLFSESVGWTGSAAQPTARKPSVPVGCAFRSNPPVKDPTRALWESFIQTRLASSTDRYRPE